MANKKKEKLSNLKFISAGTLGDLFIVLCKLITLNQKVELEHYTSHNGMKRLINELYQFFPNIVLNSTVLESKSEVLKKVRKKSENQFFVNTRADGKGHIGENWFKDPTFLYMDPYPIFPFDIVKQKKKKISFQLHSGKLGSNYKSLSYNWIREISLLLNPDIFEIHLFGTGEGCNKEKLNFICENSPIIVNKVGSLNFNSWLEQISSSSVFITPEGFSAFFSLSQKIPTITIYTDPMILDRLHPKWEQNNLFIYSYSKRILYKLYKKIYHLIYSKYPDLKPISPSETVAVIERMSNS